MLPCTGTSGAETAARLVERDAVVDADDVDADVVHGGEQFAGSDAEVHDRDVATLDARVRRLVVSYVRSRTWSRARAEAGAAWRS